VNADRSDGLRMLKKPNVGGESSENVFGPQMPDE